MIITTYKNYLITQRKNMFYVKGFPYDSLAQARHAIDLIISNTEAAAYYYYMQQQLPQQNFNTYK
jgi:hypothetical protein